MRSSGLASGGGEKQNHILHRTVQEFPVSLGEQFVRGMKLHHSYFSALTGTIVAARRAGYKFNELKTCNANRFPRTLTYQELICPKQHNIVAMIIRPDNKPGNINVKLKKFTEMIYAILY